MQDPRSGQAYDKDFAISNQVPAAVRELRVTYRSTQAMPASTSLTVDTDGVPVTVPATCSHELFRMQLRGRLRRIRSQRPGWAVPLSTVAGLHICVAAII